MNAAFHMTASWRNNVVVAAGLRAHAPKANVRVHAANRIAAMLRIAASGSPEPR